MGREGMPQGGPSKHKLLCVIHMICKANVSLGLRSLLFTLPVLRIWPCAHGNGGEYQSANILVLYLETLWNEFKDLFFSKYIIHNLKRIAENMQRLRIPRSPKWWSYRVKLFTPFQFSIVLVWLIGQFGLLSATKKKLEGLCLHQWLFGKMVTSLAPLTRTKPVSLLASW